MFLLRGVSKCFLGLVMDKDRRHTYPTNRLRKPYNTGATTTERRVLGLPVRTLVFLLLSFIAIKWAIHIGSLPGSGLVRVGLFFFALAWVWIYVGFFRPDPYRHRDPLTPEAYIELSKCADVDTESVYHQLSARSDAERMDAVLFGFSRGRVRGMSVWFIVLALGFIYMGLQVEGGQQVIARWITPYPSITDITPIPPIHKKDVFGAIIETADAPAKVHAFYSESDHFAGWKLVSDGMQLVFKKPHYSLSLLITPDRTGTSIMYQLERR